MAKCIKLKYLDRRPIYFPRLAHYPGGLALPSNDNILSVTEKEANQLLKYKNGSLPCYEEIKKPKKVVTDKED